MRTKPRQARAGRVLLAFALILSAHALWAAHPHLVLEVARATSAPAVDGRLDDWAGARWVELSPTAPYISRAPANRLWHDGAAELPGTAGTARDLSGRFSLRWDEGWIYLAASVSDNVHDVAGGDDQDWYFKDSVSLFLDVPNDGDGSDWIAGDHAFSFVADPSYPAHGRWWRYGAAAGRQLEEPAPAQTRLAVRMTSDTDYDLEAAIPMSALTRLTSSWTPPYAGRTVGFLVLVTDPDGGRTPFGGQLNYPGDGDDDGEWGQLRFSARETAAPPHIELPVVSST